MRMFKHMTWRHCTAHRCSTVRIRGSAPKSVPPGDTKNGPVFLIAVTRFSRKVVVSDELVTACRLSALGSVRLMFFLSLWLSAIDFLSTMGRLRVIRPNPRLSTVDYLSTLGCLRLIFSQRWAVYGRRSCSLRLSSMINSRYWP